MCSKNNENYEVFWGGRNEKKKEELHSFSKKTVVLSKVLSRDQ